MKYYHIIFTTQDPEAEIKEPLKTYLIDIVERVCHRKAWSYCVANTYQNHLHVLVGLPSEFWVAKFVQKLKPVTLARLGDNPDFRAMKGWEAGYIYFAVNEKELDIVTRQITDQDEFHIGKTLANELTEYARNHILIEKKRHKPKSPS